MSVVAEAQRRRTFAIISHPDAGKTTLTEKFLLYSGVLAEAGAVKRSGRRSATSDWMEMEQKRGISISSTALSFEYRGMQLNLLDTPGHRDFSEDTYRVLSAVGAVVMVLDSAKGIEPQTLKLFEVCRSRNLPVITFLNKYDRPGREPLELLDEIEEQIGLRPTPATWPVGISGDFRGRRRSTHRWSSPLHCSAWHGDRAGRTGRRRHGSGRGGPPGPMPSTSVVCSSDPRPTSISSRSVRREHGVRRFGIPTSVSATSSARSSTSRRLQTPDSARSDVRPLDSDCSAFVFKVQANMDRSHRDRIAFVRVCSGRFERGMVLTCDRTEKPF
ncbi:MAG: GTP-binding protein [Ilumatobacteraceae bacterium]